MSSTTAIITSHKNYIDSSKTILNSQWGADGLPSSEHHFPNLSIKLNLSRWFCSIGFVAAPPWQHLKSLPSWWYRGEVVEKLLNILFHSRVQIYGIKRVKITNSVVATSELIINLEQENCSPLKPLEWNGGTSYHHQATLLRGNNCSLSLCCVLFL